MKIQQSANKKTEKSNFSYLCDKESLRIKLVKQKLVESITVTKRLRMCSLKVMCILNLSVYRSHPYQQPGISKRHIYQRSTISNFYHVSFCEAKEKYRGVFEIQRSGDKTSSGKIGLDIRTHASPKVGQDQVSGGVSVLCWHAAPVAYVLWKPCTIR